MAYSKTVWNNNTPPDISAENLNKMEQGIADAQFPDGGSTGQILSKTNDGTGWIDAPNSAEWGNITGQLSEQTDLVSQLDTKITMPSGGTTGQVLTKTASGQAWDDVDGLPSGGTAGQVLTKNSSTSGDASWQDVDGLPAGGTAGQVLTKNSSTDGDASWQTSPSGGGGTWGYISGTLTDQTDLVAALDAKANTSTLTTVESTSTASQAYSVGDYLVYNGILYKVISAINSGETLTPNTNIEATTTGAELTSLNKGLTFKKILNNAAVSSTSYTLSDSIENYSEVIVFLRTNNYRMKTLSIPVDIIVSAGYSSDHQYIVDMVASATVNYVAYIQVAFTSATTLQILGYDIKGWTGTMYMDVYVR